MNNKKIVILISGSTATGKTSLAEQLGTTQSIEIVNADIGSFYSKLSIGTAKPDWKSSAIPHHFFDVIDDASSWTAPQFRGKLEIVNEQIWARGNIPVVVGGSAFYIQAFFYRNHTLELPTEELIESLEEQSSVNLWEQLHAIDPDRAAKIDPNDQYRLVRALAIWKTQGRKPSDFQPIFDPIAPFYFITLTRDRDQLYEIIDERVNVMMQNGWLDEVRSLIDDQQWVNFMLKKKMIGYDLLAQYLLGYQSEQSLEEIVDLIAQRTRNYAKRQVTFLKKLQQNVIMSMSSSENYNDWIHKVQEFNLTTIDVHALAKALNQEVSQF